MNIDEVIKFVYSNTTEDFVLTDCSILEELVENLKNNKKPIYPLDEIEGVVVDIENTLPLENEMKDTLKDFVAEIKDKFFSGDKIEESSDMDYVIKNVTFNGITFTKNGEIITSIGFVGNFNKAKKVALDYADEYSEGFFGCAWGRVYFHIENGKVVVDEFKKYGSYDPKKPLKESSKSDRLLELVWDGLVSNGEYDVMQRLSLADFEGGLTSNSIFYVPPKSFNTFPKKRPSTNTWNCMANVKWHDNTWKDIIISCVLPTEYVLDSMGIDWDDINSTMLLVDSVFIK